KAFKVHTWVDRGYYRIGDTIRAGFQARRIDGKPVEGEGELTLYRIGYEDGEPVETPVQDWQLRTDVDGRASQQLTASQAGQYRLSYEVTDAKDHTIEGGYLFTVVGEGFDSAQFRFNHLELIPDKKDYAPGDKVKLQINTDRAGGTVLLFVRPTNGVYLKPEVLRLDGKSTIHEIEVAKRDMPNFFVEAVTLTDATVHTETKEIVVPPEKRVLDVAIEPSKEAYKPGEKAKVQLTLTDFTGEPFVGSAVVTIYDKSVEYVSGGSNVPEIKEFFWKWRRSHHPGDENSLARWFHNLMREGATGMSHIGVFGATVAEEMDGLEEAESGVDVAKSGRVARRGMALGGEGGGGMAFDAAPMAEAAMAAPANGMAMADAMAEPAEAPGADPGAAPMAEATVRTEFADTALWVGAVTTAKNGTAEVELDMPENLTTWRIKVWGMGHGTRVGEGFTDVVTRKDLILRLQSPRFFVQSDEVVLSANVHNYLAAKKQVQVKLELEGDVLEPLDAGALTQTVEIEPNGEQRVDWRVKVLDEGEATVRMFALTDEESDAMEMKFPSFIHGMLKMEARSGVIRPDQDRAEMAFTVPAERRPEQSRLEVRYSPTLAGAMVDALPYLVEYPYGCTEQTLNRFLPTVITQKILIDMGLDLEAVRTKRANLNAQELGDPDDRAEQWKRYDSNPVFDQDEVRRMVTDGVARLTEMQLSDGGWGWFSGYGEQSYPHTTAVVVHGLQLAKQNDVALVPGMLEKGVEWLRRYQAEQVQLIKNALIDDKPPGLRWKNYADNLDALVYMVLVDAGIVDAEMNEFLYRDRTRLAVYSLAMYGIALHTQGNQEAKLSMVGQNIGQYVEQDEENQTAWLNLPGGYWWHWYGSEYEAHAYFLKLLSRTDPKGELAPRLVKYLLNNRKHATYWNSTRDTALCIEAMAEFLRASG
ncbi:MAG: alpha-2-macroglobulin family protein, partial [Thermoguttaceae bacterium]